MGKKQAGDGQNNSRLQIDIPQSKVYCRTNQLQLIYSVYRFCISLEDS